MSHGRPTATACGLDEHLGYVDHRGAAPAGQRVDSTVGAVSVHAEGEE
jgi:hypothetical protein